VTHRDTKDRGGRYSVGEKNPKRKGRREKKPALYRDANAEREISKKKPGEK